MDIKVVSTLGITDDDIEALEDVDGVAKAEGAYSADFLHAINDEEKVLHVMSISDEVNQLAVTRGKTSRESGRMSGR